LLSKKKLSIFIIFFFLFSSTIYSEEEPVDIWNLEKSEDVSETENLNTVMDNEDQNESENSIYKMNSQKKESLEIEEDENLFSKEIQLTGLYDPEENGLSIDMWMNSNGDQILEIFKNINKIKLSKDANEILNIALLTNSYFPQNNISDEQFLNIKSDWLIKNKNLKLIEDYLLKNENIKSNEQLIKFIVNEYLSNSEIEKSCEIFLKLKQVINDDYLSKFNIYCLINLEKREEAQLLFDLKKEMGFNDIFFERKFNILMGYSEPDEQISEKSILDFHLSHLTIQDFTFEPDEKTSKSIWKYLSTSNLLYSIEDINLEDIDKIKIIEKATHEKNYTERELYDLYKRFLFNINQLLNIKQSIKVLSNVESRALLYQGILLNSNIEIKIELAKILKDSFIKEGMGNAFQNELRNILKDIDVIDVPSNHTSFYEKYINKDDRDFTKIKINNKIIHQSKLINYFNKNSSKKNTEKDLNDLFKKIKKNKDYFISTKDIILIEALKSDGIELMNKYKDMYSIEDYNMPTDIQVFINNNENGMVLLRLVEIVGEDKLKDIGTETLFFIISALNQLNMDNLRNKILLKVLPLKV
tara:strand:- start:722 stop:2479 length:1758 start_codon:yes stop_codon:yes gene_type:complete